MLLLVLGTKEHGPGGRGLGGWIYFCAEKFDSLYSSPRMNDFVDY